MSADIRETMEFAALLRRVASSWKTHVAVGVAAAVLTYGITWLMPSWYRATAIILPPEETEQSDTGLPVQRFLSRMPSLAGLSNYYTPSDIFRAILQSRTVQEEVIRRFDLRKVYRLKSAEKTLREFRSHVEVEMAPDGTITVALEDRSRDRAAAMANALIEELDRFNVERRNFAARRTRQFLERRVAEMDSLSNVAGQSLRAYQERHHIITPILDDRSDSRAVSDLLARKMALEVDLGVLRTYLREDNERVVQARSELDRVKDQVARLPRLETDVARLTRDYRLYQQAYTLLTVQLEDARIRESMDTPTVTMLDAAVPPERRARPIRTLWAAAALALAMVCSVLWSERPGARGQTGVA